MIVSCGVFESPKLLMLSGIGPAAQLGEHGIGVVADLPVGEHLIDHPEGVVIYRTTRPIHQPDTTWCDAVLLAKAPGSASEGPDLMMWFFSGHFEEFTTKAGEVADVTAFSLGPDVTHPRSEGFVRLRSTDPADPPVIDPRYFTDPEGYDERTMLEGIKLARRIASQPALAEWIEREEQPGPDVTDDDELMEYARTTAYTAFHPAGTCRMGAADDEKCRRRARAPRARDRPAAGRRRLGLPLHDRRQHQHHHDDDRREVRRPGFGGRLRAAGRIRRFSRDS